MNEKAGFERTLMLLRLSLLALLAFGLTGSAAAQTPTCDTTAPLAYTVPADTVVQMGFLQPVTKDETGAVLPVDGFLVNWNGTLLDLQIGTIPGPQVAAPVGATCADGRQEYVTTMFFSAGKHSLRVMAWRTVTGGRELSDPTPEITVTASTSPPPPPPPPPLTFTLIAGETNQPVPGFDPLANNSLVDLAGVSARTYSLRVNTSVEAPVTITCTTPNGTTSQPEASRPYSAFGDSGGDYTEKSLSVGIHACAATQGTAQASIAFQVVDNTPPPPPPPPVDCVVSEWSAWSEWTAVSATHEQRTRTRTVLRQPENGGLACPSLVEVESREIVPPPPPPPPCDLKLTVEAWPTKNQKTAARFTVTGATLSDVTVTFTFVGNRAVSATAAKKDGSCAVTVTR